MLGLKLNHVSKRGHGCRNAHHSTFTATYGHDNELLYNLPTPTYRSFGDKCSLNALVCYFIKRENSFFSIKYEYALMITIDTYYHLSIPVYFIFIFTSERASKLTYSFRVSISHELDLTSLSFEWTMRLFSNQICITIKLRPMWCDTWACGYAIISFI